MQPPTDGHRGLIHRVFDILDAFSPHRPELTLTGISRRTDLPLATVHRLVGELVQRGVLERAEDGSYCLSLKLWQLAAATPRVERLRQAAMPSLSNLYQLTRQQTDLSVLDGTDAVVIASVGTHGPWDGYGGRQDAHATSGGRVLLAHAPWPVQEQVLSADPATLTARAMSSLTELRQTLANIRRCGISIDEHRPSEALSIAAGVRNPSGAVVAAVSAQATDQVDLRQLAAAVRNAASEITQALGSTRARMSPLTTATASVPDKPCQPAFGTRTGATDRR